MQHYKNIIVGAGLSGAVLARKIADSGQKVLLLEKRNHIGGNCFDYKNDIGITVHKYGPHIFRTSDETVFSFLSRFTTWHNYVHKVKGCVLDKEVPIPFNFNSIEILFDKEQAQKFISKLLDVYGENKKIPILELNKNKDADLKYLANFIYENIFLNYTQKQWGISPDNLGPEVMARVPVFTGRYDGYFTEKYQAIPANGYTKMFENMLNHKNIELRLNTDFEKIKGELSFDNLFYSGPIDEFFDYIFGALPYRSLTFDFKTFDKPLYQSVAVMNYPNTEDFTRITEYKYFLDETSPKTTVSFEYPTPFVKGENEMFYPVPTKHSAQIYRKYLTCEKNLKNVHFLGRLGAYKYFDMQSTVLNAFEMFNNTFNK